MTNYKNVNHDFFTGKILKRFFIFWYIYCVHLYYCNTLYLRVLLFWSLQFCCKYNVDDSILSFWSSVPHHVTGLARLAFAAEGVRSCGRL